MNALTREEFLSLVDESNGGFHLWVKFLEFPCESDGIYAAIADVHKTYGPVAVWCAGTEADFLTMNTYGTEWVAFLQKP